MKTYLIAAVAIFFLAGCDKPGDAGELASAQWTIQGKEQYSAFNAAFENNLLIATAQPKRKLSIKFGARPTTSALLKLVDYFKVPLAADEMIIGISEGDEYYLSTGTENIQISPTISTNVNTNVSKVSIVFNNIRVGRYDASFNPLDNTTVSGYIQEK